MHIELATPNTVLPAFMNLFTSISDDDQLNDVPSIVRNILNKEYDAKLYFIDGGWHAEFHNQDKYTEFLLRWS